MLIIFLFNGGFWIIQGRQPQRGMSTYVQPKFPENCMKMQEIGRGASEICLYKSGIFNLIDSPPLNYVMTAREHGQKKVLV